MNIGGGQGWNGATTCVSGYVCTYSRQASPSSLSCPANICLVNVHLPSPSSSRIKSNAPQVYSQCLPGQAVPTTPTTGGGTPASTTYPGTTLQSGYYWIRAVEDPNFHKYLQTNPQYTTGTAILDSYTTAGQFQIVSGQLVELIQGGMLYANVVPLSGSETKLAVTFNTTQNTYGTFSFSGDAVQWSIPSISRPNLSAWLVCANQQLFINLGSYAYMTPAGCADETVSSLQAGGCCEC
jgi:hypothetical protein